MRGHILPASDRFRKGVAALALFLLVAPSAHGNGWEHGTVPFGALLSALQSEDPSLRARAAESLGYRGQGEAVEPLLEALARPEPERAVRGAIAAALGRLRNAAALPALLECLAAEREDTVRGECATALGVIGDVRALPALLDVPPPPCPTLLPPEPPLT